MVYYYRQRKVYYDLCTNRPFCSRSTCSTVRPAAGPNGDYLHCVCAACDYCNHLGCVVVQETPHSLKQDFRSCVAPLPEYWLRRSFYCRESKFLYFSTRFSMAIVIILDQCGLFCLECGQSGLISCFQFQILCAVSRDRIFDLLKKICFWQPACSRLAIDIEQDVGCLLWQL